MVGEGARSDEPVEPVTFTVRGTPRPKSRPRFVGRRVISTANPHEKLWKKAVETAALSVVMWRGDPIPIFTGPVRVRMVFTFEPPKSERDRIGTAHTQKPDADNISKLVLDAMVRARVLADDSLVAALPVEKWWGERAGVVVIAEQIDARPAQAPSAAAPSAPDWLAANRT
jgi:Holliday junction resolvase RusA-like endonuclease